MKVSGTREPQTDLGALLSLLETATMESGEMECATVMAD